MNKRIIINRMVNPWVKKSEALSLLVFILLMLYSLDIFSAPPEWVVNENDFQNSMTAIFTISDECIPSGDDADIVAAFDISGQIRGVELTDLMGRAFMTIYSNGAGEEIFFKVYDASTDMVYNIYDYTLIFVSDGSVGTPPDDPVILNFDSNTEGVDAGPDQEIWNNTTTQLSAVGSGNWKIIEGVGGSLTDPSDPMTTLTGVLGRTYTLAWTLSDTEGCIGETDEMEVIFVIDQPEDNPLTCGDGLDNDGDGLTDCDDEDCGRPIVLNVNTNDPTTIDCDNTQSDGTIEIIHTGGELFSLDMGMTTQSSGLFSNLSAGTYEVWIQNSLADCIEIETVELVNNFDPLEAVGQIQIEGPSNICKGTQGVHFSLVSTPPLGSLDWSYSGTGVTIEENGYVAKLSFSSDATAGILTATLTEDCGLRQAEFTINISPDSVCFGAPCVFNSLITNDVIQAPNSPHVYRSQINTTVNAQLNAADYEFSAGNSVIFSNGFESKANQNLRVDMMECFRSGM